MSKVFTFWALLGVLMLSTLALAPSGAVASSPSQQACEAGPDMVNGAPGTEAGKDDGTFSRDGGKVTCTYPPVIDPVGNSENSDGKSQETMTTSSKTGQGNIGNKTATPPPTCEGPKGQCK
jgi:hypothetical protein